MKAVLANVAWWLLALVIVWAIYEIKNAPVIPDDPIPPKKDEDGEEGEKK